MAPNPKFVRLLQGLKKATENRRIVWEEAGFHDSFRVRLDSGLSSVRISRVIGASPPLEYRATLLDKSGSPIDAVDQIPGDEHLLEDLFHLALHQSKKVDDILDRSLQWVESKG